ncbi:MAG: SMC family ATPase, partial [Dehalococcoidales bacterium]
EQPPNKRKEVLASILGLALYDKLEQQAKDIARKQEAAKGQLENTIAEITSELAQRPVFVASLKQAQQELSGIEGQAAEQQAKVGNIRQQKLSLESKGQQLAELEEHIAKSRQDRERWGDQLKKGLTRIKEHEGLITQRAAIEEGHRELDGARKLYEDLNRKAASLNQLMAQKNRLEQTIIKEQSGLTARQAAYQEKINELAITAQKLPGLNNEVEGLKPPRQALAALAKELKDRQAAAREAQVKMAGLHSDNSRSAEEIKGIEEKLKQLHERPDAVCPVCEQRLSDDERSTVVAKYLAEQEQKSAVISANEVELKKDKTRLKSLEAEIQRLETKVNQDNTSLQERDAALKQAITEAETAAGRIEEGNKLLADIERKLKHRDFAHVEQEELAHLDKEIASLGYDAQQHEQARERLKSLGQYEELKRRLVEAGRLVDQEKENAAKAAGYISELDHRLKDFSGKRQSLLTELDALPKVAQELKQSEAESKRLTLRQDGAQQQVGSLKEKLKRCAELELKKASREELLTKALQEEAIYKELATAFGKKGIQAMLIETALPDIEDEANRLLGRMTDNRLHVRLETQRQSKKGDVIETLDIKIADELGTRSYEMFSGGEAFRIDFAIRIALSKLLAKRAGAPLPTLIIDEGFGTQDNAGLERLKEAINSIEGDFEKILVITHIEDLKDAFPVRIEVNKTAQGSTLSLS